MGGVTVLGVLFHQTTQEQPTDWLHSRLYRPTLKPHRSVSGIVPFSLVILSNLKCPDFSHELTTFSELLGFRYLLTNQLTGPVPATLGNLTKLKNLWVMFVFAFCDELSSPSISKKNKMKGYLVQQPQWLHSGLSRKPPKSTILVRVVFICDDFNIKCNSSFYFWIISLRNC